MCSHSHTHRCTLKPNSLDPRRNNELIREGMESAIPQHKVMQRGLDLMDIQGGEGAGSSGR